MSHRSSYEILETVKSFSKTQISDSFHEYKIFVVFSDKYWIYIVIDICARFYLTAS